MAITKTNSSLLSQLTMGSIFFLILIGVIGIYWGGLYGTFLLDDLSNLSPLDNINRGTDKVIEFWRFTVEGIASRLGRPISLFTFALQAHHWPSGIWHFKYVNLMIHLLNGCLIFWLLLLLARIMALPDQRGLLLALLTASLWLLHPFQVSTVLYVVQRMTELAALFTLAALLIYVRSRYLLAQGLLTSTSFWISISIGIGLGGILATLSKENGILLALYVLVLEATVLRTLPKPRYWQIWSGVFLYFPLLVLASYFVWHFDGLLKAYEIRDFTLVERLLTQSRVLTDYLFKILIPRPQSYGLFHDGFLISRSLLEPLTTVFAVGFIVFIFLGALLWRNKYPIFALGILWFFAGHVLESSFIGLVVYFEHRNYLPMLGILFVVIYGLFWLYDRMQTTSLRQIATLLSACYLLICVAMTWLETDLWGKPFVQTVIWAEEHPQSRYAQSRAASAFLSRGDDQKALERYQHMVKVFPEDSGPYAIWLASACTNTHLPLPPLQQVVHRFQSSKGDSVTFESLKGILDQHAFNQCTRLSSETIETLIKTLVESPALAAAYQSKAYHLYAIFYAHETRYADAIRMANQSLSLSPNNRDLQFQQLVWLQTENRYVEALEVLTQIKANLTPLSQPFYAADLEKGERLIKQQIPKIQQPENGNHKSN